MGFATFSMVGVIMLAAMSTAAPTSSPPTYSLRPVHEFPNKTWIENMAIRSNGQILGTNLEQGTVLLVDPKNPQNTTPSVVASLGTDNAVGGIVEVEDDVFYFASTANSSVFEFDFPTNTSSVWRLDMRRYASTGRADVRKVSDIPQIEGPNGLALLSKSAGTILIADATLGKIWRFNVRTGQYAVAIDDPVLKPTAGPSFSNGVNGLKLIGSTLYFSSTTQGIVGTFLVTPDGCAIGGPRIISSQVPNADDFAVGPDGSIWLAENISNTFVRVFPDGKVVTILSNNALVVGPVSARFGRTPEDRNVLYISTDGLTLNADQSVKTSNGKILAINTQ